jgi:hypothetical protein
MAPEPWTFRQSVGLIVGTTLAFAIILLMLALVEIITPDPPRVGVVTPSPTPYPSGWTYTP